MEDTKEFKGDALYNPSGKAREYSEWACNFYNGCSVMCSYCFNKKGRGAKVLGGDTPELKKSLKNREYAIKVFEKEMMKNLYAVREYGILFSFTTDPLLEETFGLTMMAVDIANRNSVPVKILTKMGIDRAREFESMCDILKLDKSIIAYGVTITGFDEEEPNAPANIDRVRAVKYMRTKGFKTFVSMEPVIEFDRSYHMITLVEGSVDLIKVGLLSGGHFDILDAQTFVEKLIDLETDSKIYMKESLQNLSKYTNEELDDKFITRQYNLFKN